MRELKTVFLTGYAQAPKGTHLFEMGSTIGVMLEVDRETHLVVDIESTFVTDLANDYFKRVLVGFNFKSQLNEMIESIEHNMFIPSASSLIVALKIAHQRYMDTIKKKQV